jgi:hypothetical protein
MISLLFHACRRRRLPLLGRRFMERVALMFATVSRIDANLSFYPSSSRHDVTSLPVCLRNCGPEQMLDSLHYYLCVVEDPPSVDCIGRVTTLNYTYCTSILQTRPCSHAARCGLLNSLSPPITRSSPAKSSRSHNIKAPGTKTRASMAHSPPTHSAITPALNDAAAAVKKSGKEAFAVSVLTEVAVVAGPGAPLRLVALCVGVGKLSVALRELNCTAATAESVALTDTVVTVVICVERRGRGGGDGHVGQVVVPVVPGELGREEGVADGDLGRGRGGWGDCRWRRRRRRCC